MKDYYEDIENARNTQETVLKFHAQAKRWIAYTVLIGSLAVVAVTGILVGLYLTGNLDRSKEYDNHSGVPNYGTDALQGSKVNDESNTRRIDDSLSPLDIVLPPSANPSSDHVQKSLNGLTEGHLSQFEGTDILKVEKLPTSTTIPTIKNDKLSQTHNDNVIQKDTSLDKPKVIIRLVVKEKPKAEMPEPQAAVKLHSSESDSNDILLEGTNIFDKSFESDTVDDNDSNESNNKIDEWDESDNFEKGLSDNSYIESNEVHDERNLDSSSDGREPTENILIDETKAYSKTSTDSETSKQDDSSDSSHYESSITVSSEDQTDNTKDSETSKNSDSIESQTDANEDGDSSDLESSIEGDTSSEKVGEESSDMKGPETVQSSDSTDEGDSSDKSESSTEGVSTKHSSEESDNSDQTSEKQIDSDQNNDSSDSTSATEGVSLTKGDDNNENSESSKISDSSDSDSDSSDAVSSNEATSPQNLTGDSDDLGSPKTLDSSDTSDIQTSSYKDNSDSSSEIGGIVSKNEAGDSGNFGSSKKSDSSDGDSNESASTKEVLSDDSDELNFSKTSDNSDSFDNNVHSSTESDENESKSIISVDSGENKADKSADSKTSDSMSSENETEMKPADITDSEFLTENASLDKSEVDINTSDQVDIIDLSNSYTNTKAIHSDDISDLTPTTKRTLTDSNFSSDKSPRSSESTDDETSKDTESSESESIIEGVYLDNIVYKSHPLNDFGSPNESDDSSGSNENIISDTPEWNNDGSENAEASNSVLPLEGVMGDKPTADSDGDDNIDETRNDNVFNSLASYGGLNLQSTKGKIVKIIQCCGAKQTTEQNGSDDKGDVITNTIDIKDQTNLDSENDSSDISKMGKDNDESNENKNRIPGSSSSESTDISNSSSNSEESNESDSEKTDSSSSPSNSEDNNERDSGKTDSNNTSLSSEESNESDSGKTDISSSSSDSEESNERDSGKTDSNNTSSSSEENNESGSGKTDISSSSSDSEESNESDSGKTNSNSTSSSSEESNESDSGKADSSSFSNSEESNESDSGKADSSSSSSNSEENNKRDSGKTGSDSTSSNSEESNESDSGETDTFNNLNINSIKHDRNIETLNDIFPPLLHVTEDDSNEEGNAESMGIMGIMSQLQNVDSISNNGHLDMLSNGFAISGDTTMDDNNGGADFLGKLLEVEIKPNTHLSSSIRPKADDSDEDNILQTTISSSNDVVHTNDNVNGQRNVVDTFSSSLSLSSIDSDESPNINNPSKDLNPDILSFLGDVHRGDDDVTNNDGDKDSKVDKRTESVLEDESRETEIVQNEKKKLKNIAANNDEIEKEENSNQSSDSSEEQKQDSESDDSSDEKGGIKSNNNVANAKTSGHAMNSLVTDMNRNRIKFMKGPNNAELSIVDIVRPIIRLGDTSNIKNLPNLRDRHDHLINNDENNRDTLKINVNSNIPSQIPTSDSNTNEERSLTQSTLPDIMGSSQDSTKPTSGDAFTSRTVSNNEDDDENYRSMTTTQNGKALSVSGQTTPRPLYNNFHGNSMMLSRLLGLDQNHFPGIQGSEFAHNSPQNLLMNMFTTGAPLADQLMDQRMAVFPNNDFPSHHSQSHDHQSHNHNHHIHEHTQPSLFLHTTVNPWINWD